MDWRDFDVEKAIVGSGKQHRAALKQAVYLHNYKEHYEAISDSVRKINTKRILQGIMREIIQRQKAREEEVYQAMGVKNVNELNKKYKEYGGANQEFLNTEMNEIVAQATVNALGEDWMSKRVVRNNTRQLNDAFIDAMDKIIEDSYGKGNYSKDLAPLISKGINTEIAKVFNNIDKRKTIQNKSIKKYTGALEDSIGKTFKGHFLEEELNAVLSDFFHKNLKNRSTVNVTATNLRQGKQIKSDVTMHFANDLISGISAKNYKVENNGHVKFALHSDQKISNFFRLVNTMRLDGAAPEDLNKIVELVKYFDKPDFKYHLVNEAAYATQKSIAEKRKRQKAAGRKLEGGVKIRIKSNRTEQMPAIDNLTNFIKYCLPLFLGSQMKISGDLINVDFLNIKGEFIPVSSVLEEIFGDQRRTKLMSASNEINIYNNYEVPWEEMLAEKKETKLMKNNFYTSHAIAVGGREGTKLYNEMKIGSIYLHLTLEKFKKR